MIELLSFIPPPPPPPPHSSARFPLIECVLSIRGGCRGGLGRGRRGQGGGSVARVAAMKGVFHSFTRAVSFLLSAV